VISFDCEELRKLVRMELPRPVPIDNHGFDDRERVARYLHSNGDKRTIQFEHSNIRKKIKESATKLKNRSVIAYWYIAYAESSYIIEQRTSPIAEEYRTRTSSDDIYRSEIIH
jgi:hypothetical protein